MDPREEALRAFAAGPWGQATATPKGAAGLCKRATLALLAELDFRDLRSGVSLWSLAGPLPGAGRGDTGTHWVLSFDAELVDVSARQFDHAAPHIRRGPLAHELTLWGVTEEADPDDPKWWRGDFLRRKEIHPEWRQLRVVQPPGDLPVWPYPRHLLGDDSPWIGGESQSA